MAHRNCAEANILKCSKAEISNILGASQLKAHRDQVKRRRQVLEWVVEVLKVIGKRGLSYREVENEAAYMLDIDSIDHGDFLEMITL